MIELMETVNRSINPGKAGELNIWISANNKLLVHQTTSRIKKDLGTPRRLDDSSSDEETDEVCDAVIKGKIFSWTSGHKNTNVSVEKLAWSVAIEKGDKQVDMIVMCAHSARFRYLNDLLEMICPMISRRVSIWIDEADRTIAQWSRYADILRHPAIRRVTMVTATFQTGLEKYGKVSILPYTKTAPDCYRCLADCKLITEKGPSDPAEYVSTIMEKYGENLAAPGMRAFIPGDMTQQSHEAIAKLLLEDYGFVVLILNGAKKEIRFPDGRIIDLKPYLTIKNPDETPEEFNKLLSCIYSDQELYAYPLAITGFICVERGVTFQSMPLDGIHDGFLFDYAIVPPVGIPAEAYQTMARMFGNVGDHPSYKSPEIYSDADTFERVTTQEKLAINIARIVQEYNLLSVGADEIALALGHGARETVELDDFDHEWVEFTPDELSRHPEFADYLSRLDKDGLFYKSSITHKKKLSYEELMKLKNGKKTAYLNARADTMKVGREHAQRRNYVAYRDLNDHTSAVFFIRDVWRIRAPLKIEDRVRNRSGAGGGNPF